MGFQSPETRNNCLFGEMLCACRFKFHSLVAPKITHFSPSHALPFTQTPSPKSPSRGPFSPSQPPFLSRRLSRQKPSHGRSQLSPHTPSLPRRHPIQNALRGLTTPSHAPPCLNTSSAQHASEGLLRGFPEVFQSNLQNLSHPLRRNGSIGMPAAKKGGF